MLFYVLLGCFLPLTTTEVLTTVQPPSAQEMTVEPSTKTQPETHNITSTLKKVTGPQPRTDASEILIAGTMLHFETTTNQASNDVQTLANGKDLTTLATQSYAPSPLVDQKSKMLGLPTTSNMNATETTDNQPTSAQSSGVFIDLPTSTVQSGEPSTINSTQKTVISDITSTTLMLLSSTQTSQTNKETNILVVATDRPTTKVYPTAKLSETTQNAPTVQKMTTRLFKTTEASTRKPLVPIQITTTANEVEMHNNRDRALKHGKIVAGLIGGALIIMMIGFLVILYKKHNLKKHQIATSDWAGPTPFMETGTDNGQVTLRSSNRISLASFLPQRLSKRLSLLPETGEEMQELSPGSTFACKQDKNDKKNKKTAPGNNEISVNSTQTEEIVLVNETSQKNGESKPSKEKSEQKPENGQTQSKPDNVQDKTTKEENGQSENTPTQPATEEDPPKESNNDKIEKVESNGPNLV